MNALPIDLALAWESLPALFDGLMVTVFLTALPLIIGLALAFPICFARMSARRALALPAEIFVVFFRGAPLLILLYLVYYGLGQIEALRNGPFWIVFGSPFGCAIVALSLNHAAYMVEVLRGSLLAVPHGIVEASEALGITRRNIFLWVRMPLALRYGLKAYQNEVVSFVKGTAIVSVVTITDLMAVANSIFEQTYDPFTPILCAAAFYWAFVNLIRVGFTVWGRWLSRHSAEDAVVAIPGRQGLGGVVVEAKVTP
ncbi:ABC transporter permease [Ancylobacter vacuolatus]|uniref:His/Glu/Gln/Arg/opine family amino acid ABC transporter permease subunit n=1 Tax=Ancylobacter vacuolatus TaxID=223389 RepID=A0ABU0DIA5_9HYPH|nr:ABC transporter permease subunit [Ancylobacter vacuolatus]MDQ0348150.1 His/Glu/Gln/Arg/opine family amino acid ABC transporter permease subunit [Ancylobacter vacuolatus]